MERLQPLAGWCVVFWRAVARRTAARITSASTLVDRAALAVQTISRPHALRQTVTSALHQQVRRTIKRHDLCPPGSRILIGVSGGSDSVALALLLLDLSRHSGFAVAGLAHFNHGLRATAARDEAFCRELSSRVHLPFVTEAADVRGHASSLGLSIEDAARRLRYAFFDRAARDLDASRVAVGHTQDDQAETFLLKLMRGAGATGLAGIYPRKERIIRPLLEVARTELRTYLLARGQAWMEDESNEDQRNPRNAIRHTVLPALDRAASGETRPAIARAAALVREDAELLDALSRQRFDALSADTPGGLEFDTALLRAEPRPVLRRLIRQALLRLSGSREVGLEHVETVLDLLEKGTGGADLPVCRVELRTGTVVLVQRAGPK